MTITVLMVIGAVKLIKTRVGRAFIAIRDSDIAAEAMGVNLTYYKRWPSRSVPFMPDCRRTLCFYSRVYQSGGISSRDVITFLAMVVVGGLGSIMGSIAGAALLTYLDIKLQVVQEIPGLGSALVAFSQKYMSMGGISNIAIIVYGLIMILIVLFEPLGISASGFEPNAIGKRGPFEIRNADCGMRNENNLEGELLFFIRHSEFRIERYPFNSGIGNAE